MTLAPGCDQEGYLSVGFWLDDARNIVRVNIDSRGWVPPNISEELESAPIDSFRLANKLVSA